ncbi:50S ribosomal protein L21 [Patescibacteria group bacterium]
MIAVIKLGGKQHKIKENEVLKVNKLKGEKGDKIKVTEVLILSDDKASDIKIGKPFVEGVTVTAEILAQDREKKINVIKYKRKTRYRRKLGHRQHYTRIKILSIK